MTFLRSLLLSFPFVLFSLHAESDMFGGTRSFETDDTIAWSAGEDAFELPCGFFGASVDYEKIFRAGFQGDAPGLDAIGYSELDADISYTRLICKRHALGVGIGWTGTKLVWDQNPFFGEDEFNTFNISVNGLYTVSKALHFKAGASMSIDTNEWDLSSYTFYNFTGWARYAFCFDPIGEFGLNGGVTIRAGLKDDLIYPVLGVDFFLGEQIQVNLIFPIDMYIRYLVTENWRLEIGGKIWNARHRLGPNEPLSRGYFQYENAGIECGVTYEWKPIAEFNLHAGSTIGNGDIKVSNSSNSGVQQFDIRASLYIGGAAEVRF